MTAFSSYNQNRNDNSFDGQNNGRITASALGGAEAFILPSSLQSIFWTIKQNTMSSKRQKTQKRIEARKKICGTLSVSINEFNTNSFRLKKQDYTTIDYYPKSNRVFFHDVKEWGEIVYVWDFIKYQFSETKN